ncbi:MAG: 50S ribosomal protein L30 [Nitrososphaerota archaeon]|nr:50S ribosomal protein L30 [Candidatus Bathyarchaeota archaeon]MDW8048106.1 50S ribosomal protein L30 [Nitrososphaerota archaeon]
MEKGQRCIAVVRVRGQGDVRGEIEDTMRMLNLNRIYHATIIDDRPSYLGMLHKAQNYITWGEVSKETLSLLLSRRGRTLGNRKLTDEFLKTMGYNSIEDLAEDIYSLKVEFRKLEKVKPIFRLHPPRKGMRSSVKKSWKSGGATGYRGEAINDLLKRMM